LQRQREERAELRERQRDGLHSYELLDRGLDRSGAANDNADAREAERDELRAGFRRAAKETTRPRERDKPQPAPEFKERRRKEHHRVRDPADAIGSLGLGALGGIAEIGERFFDGLFGQNKGRPPRRQPEQREQQPANDPQPARATDRQQRAQEAELDEAARLFAYWEERRRSRGQRDRD